MVKTVSHGTVKAMGDRKSSQPGNKFILLDLIGVGGMVEAYRCKLIVDRAAEKIIAVKKLVVQTGQDDETVANFIDEARHTAMLQHDNIAQVYDYGEIEGSYFIAMEYIFGKDLFSIAKRVKELGAAIAPQTALLIASKICSGLEYAHSLKDCRKRPLNITHRDLRPDNIYITYKGDVKITDFGINRADLYENRTAASAIKGKIIYMSPEQFTDEKIDGRTDIFTIGILLYEMLCGQKMYAGDAASLIRKCMYADYIALEDVLPGLPDKIYAIVRKALQRDKEKRYSSCALMNEDIDFCLAQMGSRHHPDALNTFMTSLFSEDYEAEKAKLFSTIKRFDRVYKADSGDRKLVTSYLSGVKNSAVLLDATSTLTVIMDKHQQGLSQNWFSDMLGSNFTKSFGVVSLIIALIFGSHTSLFQQNGTADNPLVVDWPASDGFGPGQISDTSRMGRQNRKGPSEKENPQRDKSEKIQQLLAEGSSLLEDWQKSVFRLELAAAMFEEALEIDEGVKEGRAGLQRVAEKYADLAEQELKNNNLLKAEERVETGLIYSPQNGRLQAVYSLIEREKNRVLEHLSWKASQAMARNHLTTPAENCAYLYYSEILKIDSNNSTALRGMLSIADKYAELAEESYLGFNLVKSRDYVEKGLKVVPEHKLLQDINKNLSGGKATVFFFILKKNLDHIFE